MRLVPATAALHLSLIISIAFLALAKSAAAGEYQGTVSLGYDAGKDDLITLPFTSGETKTIKANRGLVLSFGTLFYNTRAKTWQTQTTVGIKYYEIEAGNGDVTWTSYPVELIQFYNTPHVRYGAGVSYQFSPKVNTAGVVAGNGADLEDTPGFVVEVGWRFGTHERYSLDLRYTRIKYDGRVTTNGVTQDVTNVDGSSVGLSFGAALGFLD